MSSLLVSDVKQKECFQGLKNGMQPALLHISFISVKTVLKNTFGNCLVRSAMVSSLTRSHLTSPEIKTRKG